MPSKSLLTSPNTSSPPVGADLRVRPPSTNPFSALRKRSSRLSRRRRGSRCWRGRLLGAAAKLASLERTQLAQQHLIGRACVLRVQLEHRPLEVLHRVALP